MYKLPPFYPDLTTFNTHTSVRVRAARLLAQRPRLTADRCRDCDTTCNTCGLGACTFLARPTLCAVRVCACPQLCPEDMANLESWGVNMVRLGVMWRPVEEAQGSYNTTYLGVMRGITDQLGKCVL